MYQVSDLLAMLDSTDTKTESTDSTIEAAGSKSTISYRQNGNEIVEYIHESPICLTPPFPQAQ